MSESAACFHNEPPCDCGRDGCPECAPVTPFVLVIEASGALPLLDLHKPEMEGLNLGHEDCDECDEWKHERLVCRDCRGTDDEHWTFVLWPCPTIQHVAHALRCYPDQEAQGA